MDPDDMAVGEGLFEAAVVVPESFAKTGPPVAPPPQPPKIIRRRQHKADVE
jgi:hypothetical protein